MNGAGRAPVQVDSNDIPGHREHSQEADHTAGDKRLLAVGSEDRPGSLLLLCLFHHRRTVVSPGTPVVHLYTNGSVGPKPVIASAGPFLSPKLVL